MATTMATASTQALPRQRFAFLLLCLARFMVILDASIVNVALPSMQHAFGFSTQTLQWVVSIYSLTFGGFLLLSGRGGDLFGRRRLFMAGLLLFSLASLAGGLAPSGLWFIAARAVQGLGAALVAPTALSLITAIFEEGPARNRAFGLAGSITSFGFATGALLGGLLVAGPGWRWVMFVNVPVGIAAFFLAPFLLEERAAQRTQQHLDVVGAVLVTGGLIALVYTLAEGNGFGWLSWQTLALGALVLVLLVAFVAVELRAPAPLVRLGIFRLRTLTGGNLVSLLCASAFVSLLFVLTLYMQQVLGYSAISTGLVFLPMAVMIMVISNLVSRLVTRVGVKPLIVAGMGISALGLLFLTMRMSAESSFLGTLLPGMLIVALGAGCVFPCLFIAGTAGVSASEQGLASGLINTSQQVGGSLGLALVTTIAAARAASLTQSGTALGKAALVGGFASALLACLGFTVVAALLALLVIRESACRACVEVHVPTEHQHSIRPFAVHLVHLGALRSKRNREHSLA